MARKVKFPLELRDGYLARSNIEEVRTHFDLEKIIAQFHNGRLKVWLDDHYLPEMAEQVAALDGNAPDLPAQLCAVLGVEGVTTDAVDSYAIRERERKLQKLRQCTSDERYLNMVEYAAFDQKDLDDVLKNNPTEILLCGGEFHIPLVAKQRTYYGIGKAVAVIESDTSIDFAGRGIEFVDVPFDEAYLGIVEKKKQRERLDARRAERRDSLTPDVLAEFCSTLMLGKIKFGDYLWRDQRSWADGFYYETHSRLPVMSPSLHANITSRGEIVIGYGKPKSPYGSTDIMLFTDKRGYFVDKNTSIDVCYSDIEDVTFQTGTDFFFRIYTSDGQVHELYRVSDWTPRVRLDILRLFLLVMARLFGYCQYSFTDREKAILKDVKLRSLGQKSILEYI